MVAVRDAVDQDTNREQVVDLVVRLVALLHLLEDRPQVLLPPRGVDFLYPGAPWRALERVAHPCDEIFALAPFLRHELRERAVVIGLEVLERQVLELPPHL